MKSAVAEIERGIRTLGFNGAVLNSHFRGRYLDEIEFWPIIEALEANDAALYIHPTIPAMRTANRVFAAVQRR